MEKPLISIIIPCFNYGNVVGEAIDSCLGQSYTDIEVIVVNDGSEDSTEEVLKAYNDRVKIINQENKGLSLARNVGAEIAQGEWMLFLDADDQLIDGALEGLAACAEHTKAGVVFGKTRQHKGGKLIERFNTQVEGDPPHPAYATFFETLIVTPGAAIVRKEVFSQVEGFKAGLSSTEDRHFWLKCGVVTPFKFCEKDVLLERVHKDCMSWDVNRMIYNGYIVQLDFISWCKNKKIDTSFIKYTGQDIVERNIKRAIWYKAWDAILAIILHARFYNVTSRKIRMSYNIVRLSPLLPSSVITLLLYKLLK